MTFSPFLSAEKRDKGGGSFPQVYPLWWLNGDVNPARGIVQYIISNAGNV